jgi:hypothetical protein
MTFTELLNTIASITDEQSKTYGLVFDETTYQTVMSLQEQNPSQHQIAPVTLTDGRYALCADILREAVLGGIYASGFSLIPQELYENVGVMSWSDVVEMLPKSEELEVI